MPRTFWGVWVSTWGIESDLSHLGPELSPCSPVKVVILVFWVLNLIFYILPPRLSSQLDIRVLMLKLLVDSFGLIQSKSETLSRWWISTLMPLRLGLAPAIPPLCGVCWFPQLAERQTILALEGLGRSPDPCSWFSGFPGVPAEVPRDLATRRKAALGSATSSPSLTLINSCYE